MYPIAIHARRRRGSALSLGILVSVILTGLVMAMAWALGAQTEVAAVRARADDARYAADAALTWSMYQLRQDPAWRPTTSPMQTAMVNGWTCKITYVDLGPSLLGTAAGVLGNPLKFTVVATRSDTPASATVVATIQGVLAYAPAFWATSNLTVAQSAKVVGDVETLGSLTINGPGASPLQSATGIWKARGLLTDNNPAQTNTYFTNPTKPAGSIATLQCHCLDRREGRRPSRLADDRQSACPAHPDRSAGPHGAGGGRAPAAAGDAGRAGPQPAIGVPAT